jgi:CubicO group peptidase (beta-lactamase class C family)
LSIESQARLVLTATHAKGLAVALVESSRVSQVAAVGIRNAKGDQLEPSTVMYGASLTKAVFAYVVMRLVDAGKLDLDKPLASYLDRPLPAYDPYVSLADDSRWQQITARHALTHSTGLANFAFLEPDHKLHIHFDPGSRYAYSGEGMLLLQFVLEKGLHLDVAALTAAEFDRLRMTRTSFVWRPDFAANLADGWNDRAEPQVHDRRSRARAAGSMDTTIGDMAIFAAALVKGDGLTSSSRAQITTPQVHITTAHQFPTFLPDLPAAGQRSDLSAGLGVVVFDGPQGRGFYKGGHDGQTANTMVCVERTARCVVLLSNDVRAEAGFAGFVRRVMGDTGVPYEWEYGDSAGKSEP